MKYPHNAVRILRILQNPSRCCYASAVLRSRTEYQMMLRMRRYSQEMWYGAFSDFRANPRSCGNRAVRNSNSERLSDESLSSRSSIRIRSRNELVQKISSLLKRFPDVQATFYSATNDFAILTNSLANFMFFIILILLFFVNYNLV